MGELTGHTCGWGLGLWTLHTLVLTPRASVPDCGQAGPRRRQRQDPASKRPQWGQGLAVGQGSKGMGRGQVPGAGVEEAVRASQAVGALYACHILAQKNPS